MSNEVYQLVHTANTLLIALVTHIIPEFSCPDTEIGVNFISIWQEMANEFNNLAQFSTESGKTWCEWRRDWRP